MCVQNLNDSRGLAIRITYRISLRSSSLWEPRHPPLKVVLDYFICEGPNTTSKGVGSGALFALDHLYIKTGLFGKIWTIQLSHSSPRVQKVASTTRTIRQAQPMHVMYTVEMSGTIKTNQLFTIKKILDRCGNDPSAGSPTETLLRLHLPLNDKV
jgi:hypothetical protein